MSELQSHAQDAWGTPEVPRRRRASTQDAIGRRAALSNIRQSRTKIFAWNDRVAHCDAAARAQQTTPEQRHSLSLELVAISRGVSEELSRFNGFLERTPASGATYVLDWRRSLVALLRRIYTVIAQLRGRD